MRRRLLLIAIAGAAVGAAAVAFVVVLAGEGAASDGPAMLVATGTSEHRVEPDMATVRLGVTVRAATAQAAMRAASSSLEPVIAAVRRKVEEVQSLPARLHRVRDPEGAGRGSIPSRQFAASQKILVRTAELGELGELIDSAVEAGANEIAGPRFVLADPDEARQAALAKAVADAQRSAARDGTACGARDPPGTADDAATSEHTRPDRRGACHAEAGAVPPIEPGSMTVTAAVVVEFAAERE